MADENKKTVTMDELSNYVIETELITKNNLFEIFDYYGVSLNKIQSLSINAPYFMTQSGSFTYKKIFNRFIIELDWSRNILYNTSLSYAQLGPLITLSGISTDIPFIDNLTECTITGVGSETSKLYKGTTLNNVTSFKTYNDDNSSLSITLSITDNVININNISPPKLSSYIIINSTDTNKYYFVGTNMTCKYTWEILLT